ncbi:MAG: lipase [Rhodospirillales bacterium]|nr:lipase [Rhodospirillales bacterium]
MSVRACFFGDSFVNGVGDDRHIGWVGRVSAAVSSRGHDFTSYNLGIRRDTSADVVDRWKAESELRLRPEHEPLLVFSYGVNDAVIENGRTRVDCRQSLMNTDKILYYAVKRGPCMFIGPPPGADQELNERIAFLSAGMRAHCGEKDVDFIDPFSALIKSTKWMSGVIVGDGAHPNGDGYAELADLIDQSPAWRKHFP